MLTSDLKTEQRGPTRSDPRGAATMAPELEEDLAQHTRHDEEAGALEQELMLRRAIVEQTLGDMPRRAPLVVDVSATLGDAVAAMRERRDGCALVLEGQRLVGIFTERDALVRVLGQGLDLEAPIRDVMTPEPDCLPASASLAFALNRMSVEGYRHIPVVGEGDEPLRLVSQRDIIDWVVEMLPASFLNLPPEPRFPLDAEGA